MILSGWRLSGGRLKKNQSPQYCHTPHGEVALMHLLIKKDSEKKTVAVALSPRHGLCHHEIIPSIMRTYRWPHAISYGTCSLLFAP